MRTVAVMPTQKREWPVAVLVVTIAQKSRIEPIKTLQAADEAEGSLAG
jgi:hypothetical protein